MNIATLVYGLASYAIFLLTLLYAMGFVGNAVVPKSIDVGVPAGAAGEPLGVSLLVNVGLLAVFALQHSVMARPAFKRWWTQVVPPAVERSTFVLLASTALLLLFAGWRPLDAPMPWDLRASVAGTALSVLGALGWLLVVVATFQIDHFELFGVKQAWYALIGRPLPAPVFRVPGLYRQVRHPIYLGFILAFWATPAMSAGHLLFAVVTTAYILVGIGFEERDLVAQFGDRYRRYRASVGMLLPRPNTRRRRAGTMNP